MTEQQLNKVFSTLVQAGQAIMDVYESKEFNAELKSDNSPVTRADKASSKIVNQNLKIIFPNLPILDEENLIPDFTERQKWKQYFLLDPLDGTKEFIKQNGEFCINLALMQKNAPLEGWIYQPLTETGWYCKLGEGIYEFNKRGETRKIEASTERSDAIRIAASRSFFKPREAELIEKIKQYYRVEIKHCGSSKKQIEMVLGNADMYLKAGPCSEWDTAPGQLMVEEFGGAVLRHDTFETLRYNRREMINPYFVMLNGQLNTPDFIAFMKKIIHE